MSSPQPKPVRWRNVILVALVVLLLAIWFVWTRRDTRQADPAATGDPVAVAEPGATPPEDPAEDELGEAERRWAALLGRAPAWPGEVQTTADCQAAEADLRRVCAVLDTREYVASASIPGGVCGLFRDVADTLAARPPAVSSELASYPSMISNVFHLFRVLGRERLTLLRRIAREEFQLAEPAAMAIHRWLSSRETCARSGRTEIRLPALYDYAGYLFGTLGGQALLRRRAPEQEALVGFYALLILDRADRAGHNPHGVDPRPEIARTRALLAGSSWVLRRRYDALLAEMAARWERRSAD